MRRGLGFSFFLDNLRTNRGTKPAPSSVFLVLSVVPAKNLRTLALKLSMSQPIGDYVCTYSSVKRVPEAYYCSSLKSSFL